MQYELNLLIPCHQMQIKQLKCPQTVTYTKKWKLLPLNYLLCTLYTADDRNIRMLLLRLHINCGLYIVMLSS